MVASDIETQPKTSWVLVLEGPDGSGKTNHVGRLVTSLRDIGYDAKAFHHKGPVDTGPFVVAMDFAVQRRKLLQSSYGKVVVTDRWDISTEVRSIASNNSALYTFVECERSWFPESTHSLHKIYLTAPDKVIDSRIHARGALPTPLEVLEREAYRHLVLRSGCLTVDTSRAEVEVSSEILAWALGIFSRAP